MGGIGVPFPLALLIFSAIMIAFSAMVKESELTSRSTTHDVSNLSAPGTGASSIGNFRDIVGDILTFNIDGAPWFIRLIMSFVMIAPWVYLLAVLVIALIP